MCDALDGDCPTCRTAALRNMQPGLHACIYSGFAVVGSRSPQALEDLKTDFQSENISRFRGEEPVDEIVDHPVTMATISQEPYLPCHDQPYAEHDNMSILEY